MIRPLLATIAYKLPQFRGKHRVMRTLTHLAARNTTFTVERGGVRYELAGEDIVEYYVLSQEYASPEIVDWFAQAIGSKSIVLWDIGANIGSVALPLLRLCPNLQVVMFEPSPLNCGRLLRNLSLNPDLAARSYVVPTALSNKSEWQQFYVSAQSSNSGDGGLATAEGREKFGPIVSICRGDSLTDIVPPPNAIKLDVEGFEFEVLSGMGDLLHRDLLIVFEHSLYRLKERGLEIDQVPKMLRNLGYTLQSLSRTSLDISMDDDIIATRMST